MEANGKTFFAKPTSSGHLRYCITFCFIMWINYPTEIKKMLEELVKVDIKNLVGKNTESFEGKLYIL